MNFWKYFKRPIFVATHNGSFHADDVFACATLSIWAKKQGRRIKIIRTRDTKIIEKADIVVDVGMVYDPIKNRFDHHQKEGAGTRENGIPYSSIGLVWKHFAKEICSKEVAEMIDKRLVSPIDARDNGVNVYEKIIPELDEYTMREIVVAFRPRNETKERNLDSQFMEIIGVAKKIIENEINNSEELAVEEKEVLVEISKQNNPEILVLDKHLFWDRVASENKSVKLVICPKPQINSWGAEFVRDDLNDYSTNRGSFPESWGALRDAELEKQNGIKGSIFCHRNGFLCIANSKEAALEMARRALELREEK